MFQVTHHGKVSFSTVCIIGVVLISLINVNGISGKPVGESDSDSKELPEEVVEAALYKNYGVFSTMSFSYHNRQYVDIPEHDYCYSHYTRCLNSLVIPALLCAYDGKGGTLTKDNYCEVYLENCVQKNKWRVLSSGRCIKGGEFAEET